jgi:hypothetical protein
MLNHDSRSTFHTRPFTPPQVSSISDHFITPVHTASHITPLASHLNESSTRPIDSASPLSAPSIAHCPRTLIALDCSLPSLIALEPRPCLCLLLGCPRRSSDPCQLARVEKLPHTPTQGLCSSHWASSAITNRQHKRGEGAGKKERERRSGGLLSHGE